MPLKRCCVDVLCLVSRAIINHTIECPQLQTCPLCLVIVKVNRTILWILLALPSKLLIEPGPGELSIIGDYYLVQVCFANWALLVL